MRLKDIKGWVFGRLTVIAKSTKSSMWECQCSCGNKTLATGSNLRRGNTRSCGCLFTEKLIETNRKTKSYNELWLADMCLYRRKVGYRRNKKSNGLGSNQFSVLPGKDPSKHPALDWSLTLDEYRQLVSKDCYYCGQKPNQRPQGTRMPEGTFRNGIDRVDNSRGYHWNNCVTCCSECNRDKRGQTLDEFLKRTRARYLCLQDKGYFK